MIRASQLTKYYGTHLAVDAISFSARKGEIVGFLGPNGSGKTTTMRMLSGYLMPTGGEIAVADRDMLTDPMEARRRIGYMPETVPLYLDMTVRSYLEFVAGLRGVNKRLVRQRVAEVTARCQLEDRSNVVLGRLSKGYRQRVGLAQAIVHEPEVLILDEPTAGIDPIQVAETRRLIKELGSDRTILLSTHILPEASMVCDRAIIIHKGRIVAEDSIENLSRLASDAVRLRLLASGPADAVSARLRLVDGVISVDYEEPYHVVTIDGAEEPQAVLLEAVRGGGWKLQAMEIVERSLEDVFLGLTATTGDQR